MLLGVALDLALLTGEGLDLAVVLLVDLRR